MKTLTWQKPGQQNVAQELIKIIINYVAELRINKLAEYLYHNYPNLKIGWYSGRDKLSEEIKLDFFHYIKLGPYISSKGPLNNPNTNQRLYQVVKRENDINLFDITSYFTNNQYNN